MRGSGTSLTMNGGSTAGGVEIGSMVSDTDMVENPVRGADTMEVEVTASMVTSIDGSPVHEDVE